MTGIGFISGNEYCGVSANRPLLLNIVQFTDDLEAGRLKVIDLLDRADELGFDGIELRREDWAGHEEEIPAVRRRADDLGSVVTYATFSELLIPARVEGHDQLRGDVDDAADLGAPFLRVFLGWTPEEDHEAWDRAREAIEYADERGIALALENRGSMPGAMLSEIVHAVETIDDPRLKINLDVGNYYDNDVDVVAAIDRLANRIVCTHLVDSTAPGGAVGHGEMPMNKIMDALDALPQQVHYCFEFRGGDDPERAIERSAAYLEKRTA